MRRGSNVKVLVLGASGMLGNAVLRFFAASEGYLAFGSVRGIGALKFFPEPLRHQIVCGVDVENTDSVAKLLARVRPSVVINCIGLVKQLSEADDPLAAIPINSMLPHRLARLCDVANARFIHVSTDCVFSGVKGMYSETDFPDANDLYGRSKFLGEVDYPHATTLRTSIIGHELSSAHGLVGWFLAQRGEIKGYTRAVFSGLPTVELALVIRDFVLPHPELRGLHQVSAEPINKFDLLELVAAQYGASTKVLPDANLIIDRSLDSARFRELTGYKPPSWVELIRRMHEFG